MPACKYATYLAQGHTDNPNEPADTTANRIHVVKATTIKRHRRGDCCCSNVASGKVDATTEKPLTGKADITPDGGEFIDVQTTEPVTDWSGIFRRFNLDPNEFSIVGDTVRMSMWQTSKRTETGDRDVIDLYSYRASFRRKVAAGVDLAGLIESVRAWDPDAGTGDPVALNTSQPVSLVVSLADLQLGKGEGDGTKGTLARLQRSLASIDDHIGELYRQGLNLERVVIANMGDHTENVAGSYASQTHTVDLNMRDQLTLALEVNMQWIKTMAPMFKHMTYAACLCNHGQLSRGQGRDNITDDADNATGFIGDTLRTVCNLHPQLNHIDWVVPRDEMITTFQASGVNIAAAHGHKISGKEEDWLAKQSQHLTRARHFIPDLWHTAHKHHADIKDYGPYTRIQATTVDPGSKYYLDQSGMYSRPGVTTFIVGEHLPGKWDHYRVH